MSNRPKHPPELAEPRNHRHFDPWQSSSTGHQRATQGGSFIGSTSWREARSSKLSKQYQSGDCLPGRRGSDSTLVPGAFDGKCGPESSPKASGEWTMLSEEEVKRNQLGARDIRSFMGIGKRKADDGADGNVEKRIKSTSEKPVLEVLPKTESKDDSRIDDTSLDLNSSSDIFAGITIFINGSTLPRISEYKLKHLLASNGARTSIYMARKTVSHVLVGQPNTGSAGAGGGLSARKLQQEIARGGWKGVNIVSVDWAIESIKAGRRLAESRYPGLHVAASGQRSVAGMFGTKK